VAEDGLVDGDVLGMLENGFRDVSLRSFSGHTSQTMSPRILPIDR
jgi:hypothetical protein